MPRIGVIGGSGLEALLGGSHEVRVDTIYGPPSTISVGAVGKVEVTFLPRHGPRHDLPPHKVNYRANLSALKQLGVERVIATNAVGGINANYSPGDFVVPNDIIDMTRGRVGTYFESAPVTHVDVSQPYCPELRKILIKSCKGAGAKVWEDSVLAATEGPRYETPAEIRMLRTLGGDIVGMTGSPEVFLAREQEMCYATICFISNRAAGMQERLSHREVIEIAKSVTATMQAAIREAVESIPINRNCPCMKAIDEGRA